MMWKINVIALLAGTALAASCANSPVEVGRAAYQDHCVGCHGAAAQGDGAVGTLVFGGAPDLTQLAAANGGVFPEERVMSVIDGYTQREEHGGAMPEFGALLEGETVLWEAPDGTMTPTPEKLMALAEYLRSIQIE